MEYFIFITNQCNLNCEYCSVAIDKNDRPKTPTYSPEELHHFINAEEIKYNQSDVSLYFFGGEPTLYYDQIIKFIAYFTERKTTLNYNFTLHTNGLLLSNIPKYIIKNIDLIMLSFNYDKIPRYNLKNSYFSQIIDGVNRIKSVRNVPTLARLTITERTSLFTETMQTMGLFDYVYWQIENRPEFNNYELFSMTYMYELKLLFDYWVKFLEQGIVLNIIPFMSVLKFMFFHDRSHNNFVCGYSNSMIYIQTDGKCYACSDSMECGSHDIGSISNGIKFKKININDWSCGACNDKYLCMGRCARMHIEFSDNQREKYCELNRYMFGLFIKQKDRFEKILKKNSEIEERITDKTLNHTEFVP